MSIAKIFINDLQQEAAGTKKILSRVPEEHLSWKPHEKSMSLGRLSMHVAELPHWVNRCLEADQYDFSKSPFQPKIPTTHAEIMEEFERKLASATELLQNAADASLQAHWILRRGDIIIQNRPRTEIIRQHLSHIIHHRGQLSVYLRLLNVPLPGMYGPSADER